jgi:hypothetical protein
MRILLKFLIVTVAVIGILTKPTFALENGNLVAQNATNPPTPDDSQSIDEETYDPFSDYSEFDENSDEEADINFFRNGRFLSLGFQLGLKGYTDNLAQAYTSNGTFGFFLSYFFDMRFALQLGYNTGDTSFKFSDQSGTSATGNVSFGLLQIDGKYFLDPQNLTKQFGDMNPYVLMGLSNVTRTYTLSSISGSSLNATSSAWGLDAGGGIEIPIMKKTAYAGAQFTFHYVNFGDSNSPFPIISSGGFSTITQQGYQYDILGVLGINF